MSLKKSEKHTILLSDKVTEKTKQMCHLLLVLMLMMQLIFPVVVSVNASSENDDADEPTIVEVQAEEENSDASIESPKLLSSVPEEEPADEAEAVEEVSEPETPPKPTPEEQKEKPGENVVEDPVNKPDENTNEQPNAPPKTPEVKTEPKEEISEEAPTNNEENTEEAKEENQTQEENQAQEESETEDTFDPMLDGFPATPHPSVPNHLVYYAPGSLGSALSGGTGLKRMLQQTNNGELAPGEVRTSKTATRVPGMVNTWDITVRIEGRDDEKVESTDIVLVIDRSGSMADNNRMTNAKSAARNFIDAVIPADPNVRIAIVSFSSQYQGAQLVTTNHNFSRNQNTLKSAVNNLNALGGTHTQAGIIRGESLLTGSDANNKYMVLLSDGQPTYSYEPQNWDRRGETNYGSFLFPDWRWNDHGIYDGQFNTGTIVGTGGALTQNYNYGNNVRRFIHNGDAAIKAGIDARAGFDGLFTIAVQAGSEGTPILQQIASPGMAYSTQNPGELQGIYDTIRSHIQTQNALRNVVVQDEMGDGFSIIGSVTTTEGGTTITPPSGSNNQTITWTIDPTVQTLVPGSTNVRYSEMTYRVEINPDILNVPGAKTNDSQLFDTNKQTKLTYTNTSDERKSEDITSPKVDPVLLRIKKNLINAEPEESRRFNVQIKRRTTGFDHTEALVPNADYVWLTTLRREGMYDVAETSISGNPASTLDDFITSYLIDGENKTNFEVNHKNEKPRGDITIEVTNREIKRIDVTGVKKWEGGPVEKPNVTLQLYRNNIPHREPVTLVHPATSHTWTNLQEIDSSGNTYTYTVQEVNPPEGYESIADGRTITNIYQIPTEGTATATKIWQGSHPDDFYAIDLTLWRTLDGVAFEKVPNVSPTITEDPIVEDNERIYHYEWTNLVETDSFGNPYTFYFTEDTVPDGYERDYLDTTVAGVIDGATLLFALTGGSVRNREMLVDFSFNKVNEVGQDLAGAIFELHRHDGADRIFVERIGEQSTATFSFEKLTKGTYTLTEVSAPDGYYLPDDNSWTFDVVWNSDTKQLDIVFAQGDEIVDGEIANYPKGLLPETGGPGNAMPLMVGLLSLFSLGAIYLGRNKNKKLWLILALLLTGTVFSSVNANVVEAQTEDTTFILHKVLFDLDKMPDEKINTGYEDPAYADYETLNGAEFEVYDVTDEFKNHIENGRTTEEAQTALATLNISTKEPIATDTTAGEGTVEFTLSGNKENTAYLFHERNVPEGIKERATNMVVILPYFVNGGERLSTIHLYPKNESEILPFEKEVLGDISYEIGEKISYEIRTKTPNNPQDYSVFTIRDKAEEVLIFDPNSLTVTIGDTVVEKDVVYSLQDNLNGFTMNFDLEELLPFRDEEIVVRYNLSFNKDAMPDTDYINNASLEYDNRVLVDQALVRTGGYRFTKVDLRDENKTLADAHFVLRNVEENYLMIANGHYTWTTNKENATTFISDEKGLVDVTGLRYGRYYLEEVKAPPRYVLSRTPIPFDVTNGTYHPKATMNIVNQPGELPVTGGDPTPVVPDRPRLPITRGEDPPTERPRLPITGEMNPMIFSILGGTFIVIAITLLINENRKRGKTDEKDN